MNVPRRISTSFLFITLAVFSASGPSLADLVKLKNPGVFNSVYVSENSTDPDITVALTVLAGEVDFDGPEGLSHYLEHLMFWHADNVNNQQLHARGGNAWVNGIVTSYYNEGDATELEDMLSFVHRLFSPPQLTTDFMHRERSVVAREYDVGVSENPNARIYTRIRRDLYNNLPASRSVIGTPASIGSLSPAYAFAFHRQHYHPKNAVLYISGNVKASNIENMLANTFADLKPGTQHNAEWRNATLNTTSDTATKFTDEQATYDRLIYLSLSEWPNKQSAVKNWYTMQVLQATLDSALEGGIARPLRMDNFVLRSFSMSLTSVMHNYIEYTLYAETDTGVSLEQATAQIKEVLKDLARNGIPAETLNRVKKRMLQTDTRNKSNVGSNYLRMSEQLTSGLQPTDTKQHLSLIQQVSLDDINQLLQSIAQPVRRSTALISPPE